MARILVPDYPAQHVVAGIRTLARAGDTVDMAWQPNRVTRRYLSRAVTRFIPIPPSTRSEDEYVAAVERICAETRYDLVLPFRLASFHAVCRHQERLRPLAALMVPDYERFEMANDKLRTIELCKEIGLAVPRTFNVTAQTDLAELAREVMFPVILKVRSGSGVKAGMRIPNSPDELQRARDELIGTEAGHSARDHSALLLQEFIPGFVHDACALAADGDVLAVVTQVRQLMFPISGGVGAINVTTDEPELARQARTLLEALRWTGPTQIEFKFDPRDKRYKLIEMNPKMWGTLDLSIKAGMDFPRMIRDFALYGRRPENPTYRPNVRYKFLFPQASVGLYQYCRRFGLSGLFHDRRRYAATYYDLDWRDLRYDLHRAFRTMTRLATTRAGSLNTNVDSAFVNKLSDPFEPTA